MMIKEEAIRALAEEKTKGTDLFIVSVKVLPSNRIRVHVDGLKGLKVQDCAAISRHIESALDREQEDFELEVSSPGLTAPFEHPLQYQKNVGRTVKVTLDDGSTVKGMLQAFEGTCLTVMPERKKKKEEPVAVVFPLNRIREAKTVISFKQ